MLVQVSAQVNQTTRRRFDKECEAKGISSSNALVMLIQGVINHDVAIPSTPKPKMSRKDVFGCMSGQFEMTDDFDAPLEDFKEYME